MNDNDLVLDTFGGLRSQAQASATADIEASPDEATRAIELSKATGVHPSTILGDLEGFERGHKATLATDIVKNNSFISDYIASQPMASKISNDDYGQLDAASQSLGKLSLPGRLAQADAAVTGAILEAGAKGFKEGFGDQGIGNWLLDSPGGEEFVKNHRLSAATWSVLTSPVEITFRTLSGAIKATTDAAYSGSKELYKQFGGSEGQAERFGRDIGGMVEMMTAAPMHLGVPQAPRVTSEMVVKARETVAKAKPWVEAGQEPPYGIDKTIDQVKEKQSDLDLKNLDEALKESVKSATRERSPELYADFVRQHTNATISISGEAVAKLYGDKLPEVDDGKLGWVPRLREQLETAIATGGDIDVPLADWLARIEPELAKELHDDIRVRAGGVTKNEAKLAREAKADVDAFHGSPHEFEAFDSEHMGSGEGAQAYAYGHYVAENRQVADQYKKAGQMFADYKPEENYQGNLYRVRIKRNPEEFLDWDVPLSQQGHLAEALQRAQAGGGVEFNPEMTGEQAHRHLEADMDKSEVAKVFADAGIPGVKFLDQGSRGPTLEQWKAKLQDAKANLANLERNPSIAVNDKDFNRLRDGELEKIETAEDAIKNWKEQTRNYVVFNDADLEIIERNGEAVRGTRASAAMLEPGWIIDAATDEWAKVEREDHGMDVVSSTKPTEKFTAHEKLIVEQVQSVLSRVAPEIEGRVAQRVEMGGREVGGAYLSYDEAAPLILVSLNSRDAPKTARHEAIHFLRDFGFFKGEEWSALEKAAGEGDWLKKHNISGRYKKLDREGQLEEAIAEEFGEWGSTTDAARRHYNDAVSKAFEKLAKFFNEILQAMKEIFGHAPTIDELFEKIESGEVGRRAMGEAREVGSKAQEINEPPKKPGFTRYYHGWKAGGEPTKGGSRWVTTDLTYAKDWNKLEGKDNNVSYVDVPKGDPFEISTRRWDDLDEQQGLNNVGSYGHGEIPEQWAKQMQQLVVEEASTAPSTRMEDRAPFSGSFPGWMTQAQREKYMRLISARSAEDAAVLEKKIAAQLERTKSKEWRDNRSAVHDEVTTNLEARPDVAADRYLSTGELYGEKAARPKIDPATLDERQRASLPPEWLAEDGMHPDDIAGLFGYPTGAAMVDAVGALTKARSEAGMGAKAYLRRVADIETDRLMQERYGETPAEVLEAARDHVLSQTQMDLLHEQTYALATKAGLEFSLTKDQLREAVAKAFGETPLDSLSSTRFLADAGKAGRQMEAAFLKDDAAEAFRQSQRQYLSGLMAKEAVKLEKEKAQFEKFAKRFGKREVAGVGTEYKDFIQQLLYQAERPGQRGIDNINETIARAGFKNLQDFVEDRRDYGWDLEVADWLQTQGAKPIESMTANEFRDFNKSLKSLAFVGRAEKKVIVGGEAVDFDEWKKGVRENIKELPLRTKEKQNKLLYQADASLTRMEEIVRDLDLRRELGPLHRALIQPMMDAKHTEYQLQEALSKKLGSMKAGAKGWMKTLGETIENDSLIDPDFGTPFEIKRSDMINIMLNFGNRGNIEKFTKGWLPSGLDKATRAAEAQKLEAKLWEMIHQNAKAEDWKFVQEMWGIFEGWQDKIGTVYHNLSGLVPEWVKPEPFDTPHGRMEGGYFPIIYDSHYSDINRIRESKGDVLDPKNYIRATTGNGFARERTGYIDRVEFQNTIDALPVRMQQVMHDISYRAAVVQANRIIQDREIRGLIRKHYGNEYEAQLKPWLSDIANHYNQNEAALSFMNTVLKKARMNLSAHALGLNLKVIGSPDVGTLNPAAIARTLTNYTASVDLAWAKSKEIPHSYRNMDRDFRERLDNLIVKNGWDNFQATAVRWAFIPLVKVSQGFRIVTFVDEYKKAIGRGLTDADASSFADQQVRLRHGATGIPDLPAAMRGSEGMKMATMFYGFFNAMYNWQRRAKGEVKAGDYKKALETTYGSVVVPAIFGALLFNKPDKDDRLDKASSWGKQMSKAVALQLLGTVPFARDLGTITVEGIRPTTPIGSMFQAMANAVTDVKRAAGGKPVEKPIQHAANVVGLTAGLPLGQLGRTGQFASDVARGKQRPKNFFEWYRGIINGEFKLH